MITKISGYNQKINYLSSQNKPQNYNSVPSFSGLGDVFVKAPPIPVEEAISKALVAMKAPDFKEFQQAILKQDPHVILTDLVLKVKKIDENKMNINVNYVDPRTSGTGREPILTGTPAEVIKEASSDAFLNLLLAKVRDRSNYSLFHDETKRLNDFT